MASVRDETSSPLSAVILLNNSFDSLVFISGLSEALTSASVLPPIFLSIKILFGVQLRLVILVHFCPGCQLPYQFPNVQIHFDHLYILVLTQ